MTPAACSGYFSPALTLALLGLAGLVGFLFGRLSHYIDLHNERAEESAALHRAMSRRTRP